MPWSAILGGATGGVAVAIVVVVIFLRSIVEKVVEGAEKRFESALRRAEEVHRSLVATTATIDTDLRAHRIEVYSELWKMTGVLSKWPRNHNLTHRDLRQLTEQLRSWYFERGGMYLSATARSAYGQVQQSLAAILKIDEAVNVDGTDYDTLQSRCSDLRSQLTRDLLSRREAPDVSPISKADGPAAH